MDKQIKTRVILLCTAHHHGEKQEPDEVSVVLLPDAVSHEGAVVVEPQHALAARVAVL